MKGARMGLAAGPIAATLAQPFPAAAAARSKQKVLCSFYSQQSCADGANPEVGLIDVNGALYGTTTGGGANCEGTVLALKEP